MDKVPAEAQHEMCGLFKQSTFGDIDIKCKCPTRMTHRFGHVVRALFV